ncbi:alpha/beta hydrolase [Nocardioides montaniterrae]
MSLSRRQLLTAGGAVFGAGTLAAVGVETEALPGRSWVYRHLGIDGRAGGVPDVRGGKVLNGSFRSALRLGATVGWSLALPPGHGPDGLPVLVALHGRYEDHTYAMDHRQLALDLFLADAVAHGVPPFAIAAVDGGDTYWHRRRTGEDAGAMVAHELLPLLAERGLDTARLALLGWSMGGFGAMHFALQLGPAMVKGIGAMSPALWHHYADSAPGAFDDEADFAASSLFGKQGELSQTQLRIDCGESDPFYSATKDFRAGFPAGHTPAGGFSLGAHNGDYWRRVVPHQLEFLGQALSA